MKIRLANTTIATGEGRYTNRKIDLFEARELVASADTVESAIGHESTAQILSTLLGIPVEVNRTQDSQAIGEAWLCFKLAIRGEEGRIYTAKEIAEIGYDFFLLTKEALY